MTDRHTADTITDNDLDQLYADLARYEEVLAELNETLVHRAKHAAHTETVLREVLALFTPLATMRDTGTVMAYSSDEVVDAHRMTRWRAALDTPKEQPGPAVPAPASWLLAGTSDLNIPEQHRFTVQPVDPELERAATARARDAAALHRQGLITAAELSAVVEPGPAATEATELRAALAEALTHLYALTRVDGSTIGWQTANPISPAAYDRWQTALHPPTPTPPVPCPACTRAEQAGLDPTEQHPNCRTQETR